jgi:hypothetical protein
MHKKITSTYHEPMVVWLLGQTKLVGKSQRTSVNLLPGESIEEYPPGVPIVEISPEVEKLRLKGYVEIEDVEDDVEQQDVTAVNETETHQDEAVAFDISDGDEPDYDDDLERQLLDENE